MARQWRQGAIDGGGFMTTVAVDPSDTGILLAGGDVSGMHRGVNYGRRWNDRNGNRSGVNGLKIACIKWHPTTPGTVYACAGLSGNGTWSGIYQSTDYGVTWNMLSGDVKFAANRNAAPGLPNPWPRSIGNLLEFVGTTMYAGTFKDGLKRSTDGGTTWTPIALDTGGPFYIRSITQDAAVPHRLFVATYNSAAGGVYRVDNADSTPTVTQLTQSPAECEGLALFNGVLYGAANGGVYSKASNTADDAWTQRLVSSQKWIEITGYHQNGTTTLYAGAYKGSLGPGGKYGNIMRSTDGGGTWQDILQAATISYTSYERNSQWWLSSANVLSMLGQKRYTCNQISIDPNNRDRIFVAGTHGIWATEDGGANWRPAVRELGATINQLVQVDGNNALVSDADWNFVRSGNLFLSQTALTGKEVPADGFCMASDGANWYIGSGNGKVANQGGSVYKYTNFTTLSRDSKWDLAGATVSAQDTFNRTLSGGWGSASLGGAWTNASGAANRLSVAGGLGIIDTSMDNTLHQQVLGGVTHTDCYAETIIRFDRIPTGGWTEARLLLRTTGATSFYGITLRLNPDASLTLYVRKLVGGNTFIVNQQQVTDSYAPGTVIYATALALGNVISGTAQVAGETPDDLATTTYTDDGVQNGALLPSGSPGLATTRQSGASGAIVSFGLSEWQSPADTGIAGAWPIGMAAGTDASSNTILVAAAQGKGLWRKNVTADSGWTQVASGFGLTLPSNKRLPIAWSKVNADTLWAFDLNVGVFRSTDYGVTWSQVWSKTGDSDYYHGWIVADPTDGQVVWIVADDGVYKVTNARSGTWAPTLVLVGNAPGPIAIAPNGDIYVVDVTNGTVPPAVYKSTDQGNTWTDIADDVLRNIAIVPRDIAAKSDGTVLITTNGNGVLVYAPVAIKQRLV